MHVHLAGFLVAVLVLYSAAWSQDQVAEASASGQVHVVAKDGSGMFPAIRPALEVAKAGDTVLVKPGVYQEQLFLKNGIRLVGADATACRIEPQPGAAMIFGAYESTGISIENLCFDGRHLVLKEPLSLGIRMEERDGGVWIKEVMPNSPVAQAGIIAGARIAAFNGRPIQFAGEIGLRLHQQAQQSEEVTLELEGAGQTGTYTVRPARLSLEVPLPNGLVIFDSRVRVSGCVFENFTGSGVVVAGGRGCPELIRNRFSNNQQAGVIFVGGSGGILEKNRFVDNSRGAWIMGKTTAPQIKDNEFQDNTDYDIHYSDGAFGQSAGKKVVSSTPPPQAPERQQVQQMAAPYPTPIVQYMTPAPPTVVYAQPSSPYYAPTPTPDPAIQAMKDAQVMMDTANNMSYMMASNPGMQGCFIATAAYGSPQARPVMALRRFRDCYLTRCAPGRSFIHWYYQHSPAWAERVKASPVMMIVSPIVLYPAVLTAGMLTLDPLYLLQSIFWVLAGCMIFRRIRANRRRPLCASETR